MHSTMNPLIQRLETTVADLLTDGDQLLQALEAFGWPGRRSVRTDEIERWESEEIMAHYPETIPAQARIPQDFIATYHTWYARCLAIIERNMPSRRKELQRAHEA